MRQERREGNGTGEFRDRAEKSVGEERGEEEASPEREAGKGEAAVEGEMRGFKVVVRLDDGRRVSVFAGSQVGLFSGRRAVYEVGGRTYPQRGDGPLGVFVNSEFARSFVRSNPAFARTGTVEIWEAVYERSSQNAFWTGSDVVGKVMMLGAPPEGTDFADSVILITRWRGEDNGSLAGV